MNTHTEPNESDLELLHQLADSFATRSDDASVGPRVQMHIMAHHVLQLGHQLLDGLTRLLYVTLVPGDHDQILGTGGVQDGKKKKIRNMYISKKLVKRG